MYLHLLAGATERRRPMAPQRLSAAAALQRFVPAAFVLLLTILAAAAAEPLYQICRSSGANYTANSTYESNLNRLLSVLAADGSVTGFLNSTSGAIPDRVEGLALCRGDVLPGECRSCLATAAQDVVQICQYKKSAVIWYDYCMLRYSNLGFISVPDDSLKVRMWNIQNVTEVTQFSRQRDLLMADLVRYAVSNGSVRLFSTGQADYGDPGNPKIYGLVQCTRDQSADQCSSCLKGIISVTPTIFPRSQGARVLKATCNFRYELYPFFNSSMMVSIPLSTNATSPATSPIGSAPQGEEEKKKKNVAGTVLAIAVPLGVGFAAVSAMCACFLRRKSKEKASYR